MGPSAPVARMTYAEYLAAESGSETRHEFLDTRIPSRLIPPVDARVSLLVLPASAPVP